MIHGSVNDPTGDGVDWILLGASSLASALVKLFTPPLEAE